MTGAPSAVLNQELIPLICGAVPQFCSDFAARLIALGERAVLLRAERLTEAPVADDRLVRARGVVRYGALQDLGDVEGQRHREPDEHDAGDGADPALMRAERPDALSDSPPRQGEAQQGDRRPHRERDRQHDGSPADSARRPGNGDRSEHRPGAGDVNRTERQAQEETAALTVHLTLRDATERLLQHRLEPRDDQPDPEQQQDREPGPADDVIRDVQRLQHQGADQREDREAEGEPADDQIRAAPVEGLGLRRVAGDPAGEEDRGKHRKDARRDPGDEAADETDQQEREQENLPGGTPKIVAGRLRLPPGSSPQIRKRFSPRSA